MIGEKQVALNQAMTQIANQFAELARLMNMQSTVMNNLVASETAKRARMTGVSVAADPILSGEADADNLPPSPGR
jgi:hypothetical protein